MMMRGFSSFSTSYPKPISSMVPGRKFCTSTSETLISLRRAAFPSSLRKSMLRLFLPLLYWTQYALCLRTHGAWYRVSSPPRRSILMTSAPRRASTWAHRGPA